MTNKPTSTVSKPGERVIVSDSALPRTTMGYPATAAAKAAQGKLGLDELIGFVTRER